MLQQQEQDVAAAHVQLPETAEVAKDAEDGASAGVKLEGRLGGGGTAR